MNGFRNRTAFMVFMLLLVFSFTACATRGSEVRSAGQPGTQTADRRDQVFSTTGDAGKLVARFLKITSGTGTGSGDSTILTSPDGKVMLIDGGSPECGVQVEAYLRDMKIEKIDAVVATHPHIDHIGGLPHILRTFPVGVIYMTRLVYPTSRYYTGLIDAIQERNVNVEYLEEGMKFMFGDAVSVSVFNPERDIEYPPAYPDNSTQFINNRSLVLKLVTGDSSMLFMSDVYMAREDELMEEYSDALQADVVKVGHHGKETSSMKPFVTLIAPKVAVILHEGIASTRIYDNYRKVGADAFLTFVDGTVKVSADGTHTYTVLTQFDRKNDYLK